MLEKTISKSMKAAAETGSNIINNDEHEEGKLTKAVEEQTAKLPSISFLGLAVGSMVASAAITTLSDRKEVGNFVGLWAPCFLLLGIYNKLVKLEGSDRFTQ